MDRFNSVGSEEREETLYCLAPQDADEIICEGSDTEQTVEEVWKKRQRYEESARRYLGGHIPLIQSASLRGPLDRESGWVNPWRYRPRKEADWWQPGSEDMLFTRENVMRRAADHGLGYLAPTQALAWCKAAAETEARKEFDQFDSMEVVQSGLSDEEDRGEESPRDGLPETQYDARSEGGGNQDSLEHSTNLRERHSSMADAPYAHRRSTDTSTERNMKAGKRPADSNWLKGSYPSKRARWEDSSVSSPTPMLDHQVEKYRRRRQNSARSDPGQPLSISQPKTPWSHNAQQRGTLSRYSGSTAQGLKSQDSGRIGRQELDDLDKLQEDSGEMTFVSAPDFQSGSQGTTKRLHSIDLSFSNLEPDDLVVISVKETTAVTHSARSGTSASKRSDSGLNKLLMLPRNPDIGAIEELVEDDSFVTEVAPSSRNLEKFQFRKKRRKSKKHRPSEDHEGPQEQLENAKKSLSEPAMADGVAESFSSGLSTAINPPQQPQLESLAAEEFPDPETIPAEMEAQESTLSPDDLSTRNQKKTSPESSQFDDSYFKRVVMMPENILPDFGINSPFAPFAPFESMEPFGPFGASNASPIPGAGISNQSSSEVVEGVLQLSPIQTKSINMDDTPPHSPHNSQERYAEIDSSHGVAGELLEAPRQFSHAPTTHIWSTSPEHRQEADDESDRNTLPIRSSAPQEREQSIKITSDPLPDLPGESEITPKTVEVIAKYTQETSIDDASTQSFDSTAPRSLRKARISPEATRKVLIEEDERTLSDANDKQEESSEVANLNTTSNPTDGAINNMEGADSSKKEEHDQMEFIQIALSQNCAGIGSSSSSQMDNDHSSQPSVSMANTEPEPGVTTPLAPEEEDGIPAADEEQDSWEGCGPQSPWAAENLFPEPTSKAELADSFVIVERETSLDTGGSPPRPTIEEGSGWQPVECPGTPDNDGIEPPSDLMSLAPSPGPTAQAEQEVVSDTQLLVEAATNNPWTSNSKKRASGKLNKRVSFGILSSEEKEDSQHDLSKPGPSSPPPPQSLGRLFDADAYGEGSTVARKFGKHFSAVAGFKHLLPRNTSSQRLSSPAVGAMADRFIAADRETSMERERRTALSGSPSRHLMPKSDARTNLSPPEAIDEDVEVNLEDFINDASDFLEDWSVDSEVRKVSASKKAQRENNSGQSTRRSLLGFTNVWS